MKRLNGECKRFIVQALACFMSPAEIVESVKAEFNIDIDRRLVQSYDPTKSPGAERLGQPLRDLFATTRERYLSSADEIGIAHLRHRLEHLQRVLDKAEKAGNLSLILQVLEAAAKEMGGFWVRGSAGRQPQREVMARLLAESANSRVVALNEWKDMYKQHVA